MVTKNIPEIAINQMAFMKSGKERDEVRVRGLTLDIQPFMFPPKSPYSYSTGILLDNMNLRGKRVLEVGIGCGILSIFAAKQGAKYVEGVDIIDECVKFSQQNAKRNGVENVTNFHYSDMFSEVSDKYDTVICNLPILNGELPNDDPYWYSLFDPDFKFHKNLFEEGGNYARNILISHANLRSNADFNELENLAKEYSWNVGSINSSEHAGKEWRCYEFRLNGDERRYINNDN